MKVIESTYEILAWKYLNYGVNEKWSDWATEMMIAGFETDSLVKLAIMEKPYNQFELHQLVEKIFIELNLDYKNSTKIMNDYVTYLAKQVVGGKRDLTKTLRDLKDLHNELDNQINIYDFYCLYFAKEDLNYDVVQWYWEGATRENIDKICLERLEKWIEEH